MAYIDVRGTYEDELDLRVDGLTQPIGDYYGFRFKVSGWNGGSYYYVYADELTTRLVNGYYRTSTFTLTGFSPGRHTITGQARPSVNTTWYDLDSDTFSIDGGSTPTLTPPSFSIYDYGLDYITVNFSPVSGATSYGLYIDGGWWGDFNPYYAYAEDLTPGERYQIQMDSYDEYSDTDSGRSSSKYVTTLYPYPNVTAMDVLPTEASIRWTSVINATRYEVYLDGAYKGYTTTSRSYTFTGLSPNTNYSCYVLAYNGTTYSNEALFVLETFATPQQIIRPNNWSWEYTIASGQPFYSQSGSTVYIMRASHWNSFTSRINAFAEYVDAMYGTSFYPFSFTTATTSHSPTQIKNCINQAIAAVNEIALGTDISTIYSGDSVTADTFIELRSQLNSI